MRKINYSAIYHSFMKKQTMLLKKIALKNNKQAVVVIQVQGCKIVKYHHA